MAVTRLKRKAKRNKTRAKVRQQDIQRLNKKPIITKVDVEGMKEEFAKNADKPAAKAATKKAAVKDQPKAEVPAEPVKKAKASTEVKEEKAAKKEPASKRRLNL